MFLPVPFLSIIAYTSVLYSTPKLPFVTSYSPVLSVFLTQILLHKTVVLILFLLLDNCVFLLLSSQQWIIASGNLFIFLSKAVNGRWRRVTVTLHIAMLSGGVTVFLSVLTLFFMSRHTVSPSCLFLFHSVSKENNVCFLCFIKLTDTHFVPRCSLFYSFCVTVSESVEDPLVFPGSSWSLVMRLHLMIMLKCGRWWEWRCDKWWCWPWLWLSAKLLYCLRIARINLSFWWGRNDPAWWD